MLGCGTMSMPVEAKRNLGYIRAFNEIVDNAVSSDGQSPAIGKELRNLGSAVRRMVTLPIASVQPKAFEQVREIATDLRLQANELPPADPLAKSAILKGATEIVDAGRKLHEQLDYTFLPDPAEREKFAATNVHDLAGMLSEQPYMTVTYLHELRRTRRRRDIAEMARLRPQILDDLFNDKAVMDVLLMRDNFYQSDEVCREFWTDTAGLVIKAQSEDPTPINRPLTIDEQREVALRVDSAMQKVTDYSEESRRPKAIIFLIDPEGL
jgi:hypothetical protein